MNDDFFCPHMVACAHGPCDLPPCDKCGALCPNSSWEPSDDKRELDEMWETIRATVRRFESRWRKYDAWKAKASRE